MIDLLQQLLNPEALAPVLSLGAAALAGSMLYTGAGDHRFLVFVVLVALVILGPMRLAVVGVALLAFFIAILAVRVSGALGDRRARKRLLAQTEQAVYEARMALSQVSDDPAHADSVAEAIRAINESHGSNDLEAALAAGREARQIAISVRRRSWPTTGGVV